MKPTKTLIKTFTKIMNSLNTQNQIENFIFHRLHYYVDMMTANQTNRGFVKYIMNDFLDYSPEARDLCLNFASIENNSIWNEIKKLILM